MYFGNYYKAATEDDLIDEIIDEIEIDLTNEEEENYFAGTLEIKSKQMEEVIQETYMNTNDIYDVVEAMNDMIKKSYRIPFDLVHLVKKSHYILIVGLPIEKNENIYDLKRKK